MPQFNRPPTTTYQVWIASPTTEWAWFFEQRFTAPQSGLARRAAHRHAKRYRLQHPEHLAAVRPLGSTPRPLTVTR